jgi:hypothetical protein
MIPQRGISRLTANHNRPCGGGTFFAKLGA